MSTSIQDANTQHSTKSSIEQELKTTRTSIVQGLKTNRNTSEQDLNSNEHVPKRKKVTLLYTRHNLKERKPSHTSIPSNHSHQNNENTCTSLQSDNSSFRNSWSLSMVSTESDEIQDRVQKLNSPVLSSCNSLEFSMDDSSSRNIRRDKSIDSLDFIDEMNIPKHKLLTDSQEWLLKEVKRISIIAKSKPILATHLLDQNKEINKELKEQILDPNISPDTLVEEERSKMIKEKRMLEQRRLEEEERIKLEKKRELEFLHQKDISDNTSKEELVEKLESNHPPKDHLIQLQNPNQLGTNIIRTNHLVHTNRRFQSKGYHVQGPTVNTRVNIIGFFAQKKTELLQQTLAPNIQESEEEKENKHEKQLKTKEHGFKPQKLYEAPTYDTSKDQDPQKKAPLHVKNQHRIKISAKKGDAQIKNEHNPLSNVPNITSRDIESEHNPYTVELIEPQSSLDVDQKPIVTIVKHVSNNLKSVRDPTVRRGQIKQKKKASSEKRKSVTPTKTKVVNSSSTGKKITVQPDSELDIRPDRVKDELTRNRVVWSQKEVALEPLISNIEQDNITIKTSKSITNVNTTSIQSQKPISMVLPTDSNANILPSSHSIKQESFAQEYIDTIGEEILSAESDNETQRIEHNVKDKNFSFQSKPIVIQGLEEMMPFIESLAEEAHGEYEQNEDVPITTMEETEDQVSNFHTKTLPDKIRNESLLSTRRIAFKEDKKRPNMESNPADIEIISKELMSFSATEGALYKKEPSELLSNTEGKKITIQESNKTMALNIEGINSYNEEIGQVVNNAKEYFSRAAQDYDHLMHELSQHLTKKLNSTVGDVSRSMTISVTKFKNQFDQLHALTSKTMHSMNLYNLFDEKAKKAMQNNIHNLEKLSSQITKMEKEAEEKMKQFNQRFYENERKQQILNIYGEVCGETIEEFEKQYQLSPPSWKSTHEGFKLVSNSLPQGIVDIQKLSEAAAMLKLDSQKIMEDVELLNYKPLNFSEIIDEELRISLNFDSMKTPSFEEELIIPPTLANDNMEKDLEFDPAILSNIPKHITIDRITNEYPPMIESVLKHSFLNFEPTKIDIQKPEKTDKPGPKKTLEERRLERKAVMQMEKHSHNNLNVEKSESPKVKPKTRSKKLQFRSSSPVREVRNSFAQYDLEASPIPQKISHEVSVASSQTMFPTMDFFSCQKTTHECNVQADLSPEFVRKSENTMDIGTHKEVIEKATIPDTQQILKEMRETISQTLQRPLVQVYSERIQTSPPKEDSQKSQSCEKDSNIEMQKQSVTKNVEFEVQVDLDEKDKKSLSTSQSIETQTIGLTEKVISIQQSYQEIQTSPPRIEFDSPVVSKTSKSAIESQPHFTQLSDLSQISQPATDIDEAGPTEKSTVFVKDITIATDVTSHLAKIGQTSLEISNPIVTTPIENVSVRIKHASKNIKNSDYSEILKLQTNLVDIEKWKSEKKLLEALDAVREKEQLKIPKDMHALKNFDASNIEDPMGVMYTNLNPPKSLPVGESLNNFPFNAEAFKTQNRSLFTDIAADQIRKKANETMESAILYILQNTFNQYLTQRIERLEEQAKIYQLKEKSIRDSDLLCNIRGAIYSPELDEYVFQEQLSLELFKPQIEEIVEELLIENLDKKPEMRLSAQELEVVEGITSLEAEEGLNSELLALALVLTQFNFYTKTDKSAHKVNPEIEPPIAQIPQDSSLPTEVLSEVLSDAISTSEQPQESTTIIEESIRDISSEVAEVTAKNVDEVVARAKEKNTTVEVVPSPVKSIEEVVQLLQEPEIDDELHTFEYQPAQASVFLFAEMNNALDLAQNVNLDNTRKVPEEKESSPIPIVVTPRKEPIIVEKPKMEQAEVQTSRLVVYESVTTQTKPKKVDTIGAQTRPKSMKSISTSVNNEPQTPKAASPPKPQTPPKIIMREIHTSPIKIETPPKAVMIDANTSPIEVSTSLVTSSPEQSKETPVNIPQSIFRISEEDQPITMIKKQPPLHTLSQLHAYATQIPSPESSVSSSDIFSEISNFEEVLREAPPIDSIWKEFEGQNLPQILREDRRALLSHIIRERKILDDSDESMNDDKSFVDPMKEDDSLENYFRRKQKAKRKGLHESDADSDNSLFSQMSHDPMNKNELIDALLKASLYEMNEDDSVISQ